MQIKGETWLAVSLSTVEREPGEIISQNDKLPYLVPNPGEIHKSMNFDLNSNELVSDTALAV